MKANPDGNVMTLFSLGAILTCDEIPAKRMKMQQPLGVEEVKKQASVLSDVKTFSQAFLLKETLGAEQKTTDCFGVNILQVHEFFKDIAHLCKEDKAFENKIMNAVEKNLLQKIKSQTPNNMKITSRVFLMLPECHLFEEPSLYESIICPFADSFLSLGEKLKRELAQNWCTNKIESEGRGSHTHTTLFSNLVKIYRCCMEHILDLEDTSDVDEVKTRHKYLKSSMDMLKYLFQANRELDVVSPEEFQVDLMKRVSITKDFFDKVKRKKTKLYKTYYFCDYRFLFNVTAKSVLLELETKQQQEKAVQASKREICQQNQQIIPPLQPNTIGSPLSSVNVRNEHNFLEVSRDNLAADFLCEMGTKSETDLRKPIMIKFKDEDGIDDGGLSKELFHHLAEEVGKAEFGLLKYHEDSGTHWFNTQSKRHLKDFEMFGKVCGLALYNQVPFGVELPVSLYKQVFDRNVDRSQKKMSEDVQFESFKRGFLSVIDRKILDMFEPEELKAVMEGNTDYDFAAMEQNAVYEAGFHKNHPLIQMFWEVFHALDLVKKKEFLKFLTGSVRMPVSGMKDFRMKIRPLMVDEEVSPQVGCDNTDLLREIHLRLLLQLQLRHIINPRNSIEYRSSINDAFSECLPAQTISNLSMTFNAALTCKKHADKSYIPVAYTCYNLLLLPNYLNKDVLKEKLLISIEHNEGFLLP